MKSRVEKKKVPNLHFWAKCFSHFDDLQSNLFFPRSVRTDFSRSVVFNLVQRDLLKEIRFFTRKVTNKVMKKLEKADEKITLRFKIQFSISKRENTPETIPDPNPITKKTSVGRKNSCPQNHFSKKCKNLPYSQTKEKLPYDISI